MLLGIDQGTTGSTCLVFGLDGEVLGRAYREFSQSFPKPGWVEHDAAEILQVTLAVANEALTDAAVPVGGLTAVGITNQRETTVVWDPTTGEPLAPAIVWQDRRTAQRCDQLKAEGREPLIRERTGLVLDSYFTATKLEWMLANIEGLREKAEAGTAIAGTIDTWLIWNLTGEHATDPSNASRTLLYDIRTGQWDEELLDLFGIPAAMLPKVVPSVGVIGDVKPGLLGSHTAPVAGVLADQQAALFGQACFTPGETKATYGTGSFILMNAGRTAPAPVDGLLSTVAWGIGDRLDYALEGSIFVAGSAVQWLRDGLGLISSAAETEALAKSVDSTDGVHFVPALTGLGSPWWDPNARGTITGLTRGTTKAHLVRATLEGIAFQVADAVAALAGSAGHELTELRADGGATDNDWLMAFQADLLGVPVTVPEVSETTALGAALAAGIGVGALTLNDASQGRRVRITHEPRISTDQRRELTAGWHQALASARLGTS
ncbi:MAG: glycerol kinase GlpK [Actinobacteria bacterium]|uniref:glycerol kinase n=1 Tax=freshwater metagenome TaxID=449393 RepID=A0A6J7E2P5_9ZZZZ|nr:glycerol kinase GlpK [Actinomycetota bacterium]